MSGMKENLNLSVKKYLKNRSKDYEEYGRYMCHDLELKDLKIRLVSFLGDLVLMLFPIILWDYVFVFLAAGYMSYGVFTIISNIIKYLILLSAVIMNTIVIVAFKGQTFGKIWMNLKVVRAKDNREAIDKTLIIRELVGIELPLMILYFVLHIWGILIFFVVNGVFVIMDKKHRSLIDVVCDTKVVKLSEKGKKHSFEKIEETKEEKVVTAENKYDLHVYSSFSHDGELSVEDLLKKADDLGIKAISICDHNSVKANLVAEKLKGLYKVQYIPGINIDCQYKDVQVRVLGYFINSNDERFMQLEYENLAKEKAIGLRRIELFENFTGFTIDTKKLIAKNRFQVVTCDAIARYVLSDLEYRKTKLLQPYLIGSKKDKPISNFVKDFFGKGAPAYVPVVYPQATDMISLIKACGGVPVLAHPMYTFKDTPEYIDELIEKGIQGLELFTPYHTGKDVNSLIKLVKKYHLGVTGGSEFHGIHKPQFEMGHTKCPKDVEEVIERFIAKYESNA